MKQLIAPIAIIVALIAFFVVIDRKDFYSSGDVAVQSVSPSINRKPLVSVPETMPVIELKPTVESKLVAEAQPATDPEPVTEAKPKTDTNTKPTETKPVAEMKSEAKPSAVPVATAEEAIRANEVALKLLAKEETLASSKDIKSVIELQTEDKSFPMAVPVLTPEEATKANKEAIRFQRNIAIARIFQSFIHKIGLNNNRLHFILSLLPLLFIFDVFLLKRKKKRNSKVFEYFSLPRRICILFSVSLLALGVLVFVPWSVYFGNNLQFPFIFQDFVNWNLRVLTISIVGTCIILLLIPPIICDYLVAIIAGMGLCVYVQAMFMNQHLGTMDGLEPVWSEHRIFGTINLIIWSVIVLVPIALKKMFPSSFSKTISIATGIVLSLELIATASMVFSADQSVWLRADTYYIDGSDQFKLSKEKNVIFLVMDALGSEYVERCFKEFPETKEIVKDFTWYVEARANYHLTFPGLLHELTGTMLPAPANDYYGLLEKMWSSKSAKSFYKQICDSGYDARFYMKKGKFLLGKEDFYHNYFSNVVAKDITYRIDYDRLHSCLKQMSGFSFAPYYFKKHFFYSFDFSDDVVQKEVADIPSGKAYIPVSNSAFLQKMLSSGIVTDANKPSFLFNYILGAHTPWDHDEKSQKVETSFDNPVPTTRGCFYILSEIIRLLKEANIYDCTAIFLCSDHGGNDHGGGNGRYDLTFMVKPFHANKKELSTDTTKVQSIDILPTMLYVSCGENADFSQFEGFTPNNVPEDRVRKVYKYYHNKKMPPPDPDLDKCYPGIQGLEEYIFNDLASFKLGQESESFVRIIPLITPSQNKNNSK